MTKPTRHQKRASSLSRLKATSRPSDAVIDLGKELVQELNLGDSVDTLGRWMAHYVAELIHEAEHSDAETRNIKREACFKAILELWRHRYELPDGKRPFEAFEPVFRALQTLDPDSAGFRYFPGARPLRNDPKESSEALKWIQLANGLDYSARVLIRKCLANAASGAINKARPWIALAEQAGSEDLDLSILRIIIAADDSRVESDATEASLKHLEERASRLRAFAQLAIAAANELEGRRVGQVRRKEKQAPSSDVTARLAPPSMVMTIEKAQKPRQRATKNRR
jgi:hypothetical protein